MRNFTNPLDNVRIASPCSVDWNEMYGNDRKRFCGDCKLTVYNLSDMTRQEAENLLVHSEGRLCIRFFRRADGTVLTKNCPVGWKAVKQRVSRVATATFSMIAGVFTGVFGFSMFSRVNESKPVSAPTRTIGAIYEFPVRPGAVTSIENDVQMGEVVDLPYQGGYDGSFEVGVTSREEPKAKPRRSIERK